MSNKKSYMNDSKILNEGFFSKIARFLKLRPKVPKEKKKYVSPKLRRGISDLNKAVDRYEATIKKQLGSDYPALPRFEPEDFLK